MDLIYSVLIHDNFGLMITWFCYNGWSMVTGTSMSMKPALVLPQIACVLPSSTGSLIDLRIFCQGVHSCLTCLVGVMCLGSLASDCPTAPHFLVPLCFVRNGYEDLWRHRHGRWKRCFAIRKLQLFRSIRRHIEHCFQVASHIGCPLQPIVPNPLEGQKVLGRIWRLHLAVSGTGRTSMVKKCPSLVLGWRKMMEQYGTCILCSEWTMTILLQRRRSTEYVSFWIYHPRKTMLSTHQPRVSSGKSVDPCVSHFRAITTITCHVSLFCCWNPHAQIPMHIVHCHKCQSPIGFCFVHLCSAYLFDVNTHISSITTGGIATETSSLVALQLLWCWDVVDMSHTRWQKGGVVLQVPNSPGIAMGYHKPRWILGELMGL